VSLRLLYLIFIRLVGWPNGSPAEPSSAGCSNEYQPAA
jgi:hypothetical protein